jgi:signal transduction histidine kinase
MLHVHLSNYREVLIDRCLIKAANRTGVRTKHEWPMAGVPLFLDQLIETLELERGARICGGDVDLVAAACLPNTERPYGSDIQHGEELSECGFSLEHVVHDYGDTCQAIMDLIIELALPIRPEEFRTLNRCLNNATAHAATAFSNRRRAIIKGQEQCGQQHSADVFKDGFRQHVQAAALSFTAIKSGQSGLTGATSKALSRSLQSMGQLLDQPLTDALAQTPQSGDQEVILIDDLLARIKNTIRNNGHYHDYKFEVYWVGDALAVHADPLQINLAITNLVDNAFKFSPPGSSVTVTAYADSDRLLVDVRDESGELGWKGNAAPLQLLRDSASLESKAAGKTGLPIARRAVEANDGKIMLRDIPGSGCVSTISLPLYIEGIAAPQNVNAPRKSESIAFPAATQI